MKKELFYAGLVVFPTLIFITAQKDQLNQTGSLTKKTFFSPNTDTKKTFFSPNTDTKESTESNGNFQGENKTGRQLTYFWADQADRQTRY